MAVSGQNRSFCTLYPQITTSAPPCPTLNLVLEDVFLNTFSDFIDLRVGQGGAGSENQTNIPYFGPICVI